MACYHAIAYAMEYHLLHCTLCTMTRCYIWLYWGYASYYVTMRYTVPRLLAYSLEWLCPLLMMLVSASSFKPAICCPLCCKCAVYLLSYAPSILSCIQTSRVMRAIDTMIHLQYCKVIMSKHLANSKVNLMYEE